MATTSTEPGHDGVGVIAGAESTEPDRSWYLLAISGAVSAVIGVLVLAYPDPSIKLLGVFLGIDLLLGGAVLVVRGFDDAADESDRLAGAVLGILALIAGLIVIRNPAESLVLLTLAVSIFLIVHGAVVVSRGLIHRRHRWSTLARGVVIALAGGVILSWPDLSVKTFTVLTGIALLLRGVVSVVEAFELRSERPAAAG